MRPRRSFAAMALIAVLAGAASAADPDEALSDPALEARARAIGRELRCVVCQSQSIADSDAPLARDLRLLVRERLVAGDTDAEARDYVVNRYGEYVLLKPRFGPATAALWLAPAVGLGLAAVAWVASVGRRRSAAAPALSDEEQRAVDELLSS